MISHVFLDKWGYWVWCYISVEKRFRTYSSNVRVIFSCCFIVGKTRRTDQEPQYQPSWSPTCSGMDLPFSFSIPFFWCENTISGSASWQVLGSHLGPAMRVISVADPDPGSGAFLTPGSGIRNRFFPDPGSRIPDPKTIFLRAFRQFFW